MKRPSGFDRSPERDRAAGEQGRAADETSRAELSEPAVPGHAAHEPQPPRESLLLRRLRTPGSPDESGHSGPGGTGESSLKSRGHDAGGRAPGAQPQLGREGDQADASLAPTINLADVRAGRDDSGALVTQIRAADAQGGLIEGSAGELLAGGRTRAGLAFWRREDADPVAAAEQRVRRAARERRAVMRRERRRFSLQARRRRRNWGIAFAAVLALALFVVAGAYTPLMSVQTIAVEGVVAADGDAIAEALVELQGVPLALVADGEVHQALEPFPLIQRYAIERIPPHTLRVRIVERVPVLAFESDGTFVSFDAAGVELGTTPEAPAGIPIGSGGLVDRASPAFRSASHALRDMPADLRATITGATASSGQDVTFTLNSGVEVLWGEAVDTTRKALVLQQMLTSLSDVPLTRIDVSSSEAPVFQ